MISAFTRTALLAVLAWPCSPALAAQKVWVSRTGIDTVTCGAIASNLDTGEIWAEGGFITNVRAQTFAL